MKILLIYPLDREFLPPSMPPMGLAYIAAVLKKAGYSVIVSDLNGERDTGLAKLKAVLSTEKFNFIGISSIITQFKKVRELGVLVKSFCPEVPLVMGGPGPTSIPELYLTHCSADVVCIGEGEETIKELAAYIEAQKDYCGCAGIAFNDRKGGVIKTASRRHIADIDSIGFPAWDAFSSMEIYAKNYLFRQGRQRGMSLMSTRGCPGQCNYCMCNFGSLLRVRSIESVFEEIRFLVNTYQIEHVHFLDDTFIASRKRIVYMQEHFKSDFPQVSWSANARADMMTFDSLEMMKESGCVSLAYGIESGSPTVLKFIKKGITIEQVCKAIQWTRQLGIGVTTYFMIGMPVETPQTIRESIEFCKENLVGGEFFFATPFPGTELYRYAREKELINNEVVYLENAGEVRDFIINLTAMDNEELFTLKAQAEGEITSYLQKHNIAVRQSIRKDPRESALSLPKF